MADVPITGEIKPYDPTVRERLSSGLQAGLEKLGVNRYKARQRADTLMGGPSSNLPLNIGLADFVPFLGTGLQTQEAVRGGEQAIEAAKRGDVVDAGVEGTFAALGLIPGAAGTVRAARALRRGEKFQPVQTPDVPKIKESRYETAQEGPFLRVKPRSAQAARPKDRGVREEVRQADTVGGSGGGDVPQPITDEAIGLLIKDPSNFVYRTADDYSQRVAGQGYQLPQMPPSSLAKQSAIGRTFQLAADGDDAYKRSVFEAYGKRYPQLVEATGAQNYDQLLEASYRQLAKETADQFHALPVNMSYHRAGEGNYQSSGEMLKDIYGNRHLYVYQGGDPHDFLNAIDPETGLNTNEMFRAIHDFYGHAVHGNPFGPKGEEIAFGAHAQMFSPLARMAMASETRGQNSFVNYTPVNAELKQRINRLNEARYEANRRGQTADVAEIDKLLGEAWQGFQFAPQKSVLLPPEFVDTAYTGGMPGYIQPLIRPEPGTTASEMLTHFSHSPDLQLLDPTRYGTGIKGREMERLLGTQNPVMERSYAYTGDPSKVRPEPGLGRFRYGTRSEGLYDLAADPMLFRTLAAEANRTPFTAKANKGMADPTQAFTDVERMAKEYGYEGLMNPQQGTAILYRPTPVQPFQAGGAVKPVKEALKKGIKGALEVLSPAESEANKARFLAESQVKDRMYHGTKNSINSFDLSKRGTSDISSVGGGVYLTPDPNVASFYSKIVPGESGSNVMPVYAQVKNPFEYDLAMPFKSQKDSNEFSRKLQEAGYDSIVKRGKDGQITELVVFEPSKIKSAIGNRGTFDTREADITKRKGGLAAVKGRR